MGKVQDGALIVLGLGVAVTIYFTVTSEVPEGEPLSLRTDGARPSATSAPPEDERSHLATDDAARSTSVPVPASSTEDTKEKAATEEPPAVDDPPREAIDLLASGDPVTVTVLGDSTGDSTSEWVHLWAQGLAADRPVTIAHWKQDPGTAFYPQVVLSDEGDAGRVTIWNGSVADGTAAEALEEIDALVPEIPDLVLLNFGHAQSVFTVVEELQALHEEVQAAYGDVPTLLILQNPQRDDANASVREAAASWAAGADVRVIDVASVFEGTGVDLLSDDTQPDDVGQELWARTVGDALQ